MTIDVTRPLDVDDDPPPHASVDDGVTTDEEGSLVCLICGLSIGDAVHEPMTEQETITEYAERRGITLTIDSGPVLRDDEDGWEHNAYEVTLYLAGATITTPYKMGTRLTFPPRVDDVLDSLVHDAEYGALDFEDYCGELGEDTDSRRAWKTWEACQRTHDDLVLFLGGEDEWDAVTATERL